MLLVSAAMAAEVEIQKLLTAAHIKEWLRHDLFQPAWWLLLALAILIVALWWRALDKARLPEGMLYAVIMTVAVMGVDEYGEELILWDYPVDIVPVFPVITALNLWILPLVYSLLHQRCPTWRSFVPLAAVAALAVSFVFEPALAQGEYYQLLAWRYYYNTPVYFAIAVAVRWLVIRTYRIAAAAR